MLANVMTLEEVASHLKVHKATVRSWILEGKLPARKFGSQWRILEADLKTFMEKAGG